MSKPAVSIVVTNFNYGRYLETCLRSCVSQKTTVSFETIVVDDGSTDDSVAIADRFAPEGVRLLRRENGGIEAASNTGIAAAAADLFVRVDADDFLLPGYLEEMVPRLSESDAAFAYSDYVVLDSYDREQYTERLPDFDPSEIRSRGDFLATGTLYRKDTFEGAGRYDETTRNSGLENYQLVLDLLGSGLTGLHVAKPLFAYRRHQGNFSVTRRDAIVSYGRSLFRQKGLGRYRTNAFHPYKLTVDDE